MPLDVPDPPVSFTESIDEELIRLLAGELSAMRTGASGVALPESGAG
jgi:hypothetical protein